MAILDSKIGLCYKSFKSYLRKHQNFPPSENALTPTATEEDRAAARYDDGLNVAVLNRVIFFTKHGRIGLGPRSTSLGDTVTVLYGLGFPAVMRNMGEPDKFALRGMSYVHGLMDGQALQVREAMGLKKMIFRII